MPLHHRSHPSPAADRVRKCLLVVPFALVVGIANSADAAPRTVVVEEQEVVVEETQPRTVVVEEQARTDDDIIVIRKGPAPREDDVVVVVEDKARREVDVEERPSRIRMHFDTQIVGGSAFDPEGNADWTYAIGGGFPRASLFNDRGALTRPLIGFGLGYVFDDRAILGAKMAFTIDAFAIEDDDPSLFVGGRFVPYFHWMFLPGRMARPYMEVRAGIGGSTQVVDSPTTAQVRSHVIYPMAGAGLGVHLFPSERFSLDLGLDADYIAPFAMTAYSDPDREDTDWDKRGDLISFGVSLGFSAWF